MKTFDLIKKLSLSESEGWSYVPFASGNNSRFYSNLIENHYLTLAWVAVKTNITANDLQQHHFKREKNDVTGIVNSLPRLIIVTDGKQWYLSKQGDEQFTPVKFSMVLISLYNEIKAITSLLDAYKHSKSLQKNLRKSMERLKLEVRNYGESIPEIKKPQNPDLFTGSGQFQTDMKSDLMPYINLTCKDKQFDRYSKILHELLFLTLNHKQLQFLLKFQGNDVYANPLYKKGQLFICITKHFFKDENEAVKHKPIFLIVDKYACTKSFHPSQESLNDVIIPKLLKIDLDLVNEFLTKEPF